MIEEAGRLEGSLPGGCVEAGVITAAIEAIAGCYAEDAAIRSGMRRHRVSARPAVGALGLGGKACLMRLVTLHLNRLRSARIAAVLVTRRADREACVVAEGETPPSLASTMAICEALHSGQARISELGDEQHFMNLYLQFPWLAQFGHQLSERRLI